MYNLEVPYRNGDSVLIDSSNLKQGRPYIEYLNPNVVRVLMISRHNWCIENNIWYDMEYIRDANSYDLHDHKKYFIIFKNKSDAMLFKLTWM
jgi:hypothetical protein